MNSLQKRLKGLEAITISNTGKIHLLFGDAPTPTDVKANDMIIRVTYVTPPVVKEDKSCTT